ncbi:MAG: histidinol-phosphate transaminase [Betaproteobacteria bacterium]|nr:MAG: histidinol-phosphate transaminase [Betaproteobacteria bacterium]
MNASEQRAGPAELAPEYVRRINPYVPGKPIDELAREYGLAEEAIVKLASNENPRGPSPRAREAIVAACAGITRYPDGNGFALKNALAARYGVDCGQIVLGNGSNDVLELATQAFLRPGDQAVYSQHAFAVYPLATQARGAIGIEVPARDYGHDLETIAKAVTPRTRIVFVANPNNPTGTWLSPAAVKAFLAVVAREVLVVLDEAYDEYLDAGQRSPSMTWIAEHRNLIVSRTFSKAYGLAGLRVGFGVMDPDVADMLNRVRQPFNVSSVAQAAALAALADTDYVAESARLNRAGLAQLSAALEAMRVAYVPSHANFLLVHVGNGGRVYEHLLRQGVIVRPVANYGLPEHVRVTVGLPEENRRFLAALESALGRRHG